VNLVRTARRAAPAVVLLALLAGCSRPSHEDGKDRIVSPRPSESPLGFEVPPPPSPPLPPAVDPSHWPTGFRRAEAVRYPDAVVIRAEYTGEKYLKRLAATWGVTMEARTEVDFPGKAWHQTGHNAGPGTFWISADWAPSGSLLTVYCTASSAAPKALDFLADCARFDYPDSTPEATARWLRDTWPGLHAAAEGLDRGAMESPALRSGPVAILLYEGNAEPYGGAYRKVHLFGIDQE